MSPKAAPTTCHGCSAATRVRSQTSAHIVCAMMFFFGGDPPHVESRRSGLSSVRCVIGCSLTVFARQVQTKKLCHTCTSAVVHVLCGEIECQYSAEEPAHRLRRITAGSLRSPNKNMSKFIAR